MEILATSSCVYVVRRNGVGGASYALAGLRSAPPIVVLGANFTTMDMTQAVHCLDDRTFLYEFGQQIADGVLMGVAMLGAGSAVGLANFANAVRISRNHSAVSLSTPLGGYRVHPLGLGLSTPDAEFNLQPFSIPFKVVP